MPVQQLMLVVAVTYAFSAVSALLLTHARRLRLFALAQIGFDVLLVTGVIYLTGGVESPFPFLYSLPIINAAVLLFGEGALLRGDRRRDRLRRAPVHPRLTLGRRRTHAERFDLQVGLRIGYDQPDLRSDRLPRQHPHPPARCGGAAAARKAGRARSPGPAAGHAGAHHRQRPAHHRSRRGASPRPTPSPRSSAGRPASELVGQEIGSIFPPLRQTGAARLAFLQSSAASGPIEFLHGGDDDRPLHLRCVAAPLASTFGFPIGALYVLQNVTQLKEEILAAEPPPPDADRGHRAASTLDAADDVVEAADGLYGVSPGMARIRDLIDRVAGSDATVLIAGESGTGKEVVARAMHARGPRRDKPFVAINCGAIPENLIESELFGHVRGAFTGAVADRPGCFRQRGRRHRCSSTRSASCRCTCRSSCCASCRSAPSARSAARPTSPSTCASSPPRNRDLHAQVQAGQFREDLFYRLNVITIELPPLRERREDIPLLIRHFLRQFSDLHERRVLPVLGRRRTRAAPAPLPRQHSRAREHRRARRRAVRRRDGHRRASASLSDRRMPMRSPAMPPGEPNALPSMLSDARPTAWPAPPRIPTSAEPVDLEADLAEYEKAILLRALDQAGGVKKRAAEMLGINYRSLRHRLQKYGLSDSYDDQAMAS